jgi:adenylate cyclase
MAGGLLALWLLDPIVVQRLRLAQFDQFQRWAPRVAAQVPLRVVDIDEASLQAYGQWPWPRTRMVELVEQLHQAGAAAMARLWNNPQVSAALTAMGWCAVCRCSCAWAIRSSPV